MKPGILAWKWGFLKLTHILACSLGPSLSPGACPILAHDVSSLPQIEHDPRMPAYIATQGPLSHTIADFWQVSSWKEGFSRDQWPLRAAGASRGPETLEWSLCP